MCAFWFIQPAGNLFCEAARETFGVGMCAWAIGVSMLDAYFKNSIWRLRYNDIFPTSKYKLYTGLVPNAPVVNST